VELASVILILQKLHGHIALLAVAACMHPPIALRSARRPSWSTRMSAYSASFLVIATNVLGWYIYPAYREEVKRPLYRAAAHWGELFEVKEHLAFYAFCLAIAAVIMVWASSDERGLALRQSIRVVYALIGLLTLTAGVMGILISSVMGFDYGASPTP
jgi:hypothetical protein